MAVGPGGRTETGQDRNPTTNVFLNFVYSVEDYLKHMELSKSKKKNQSKHYHTHIRSAAAEDECSIFVYVYYHKMFFAT